MIPKSTELPFFITRPGNTWSGKEEIEYQLVPEELVKEHIVDLLSGESVHYSKSRSGTQLSLTEANSIVSDVLEMLTTKDKNWKAFLTKPDFLNQVDDYFDSGYIVQGYFEGCGRDMAMVFLVDNQVSLLLTNGYP